MCSVFRSKRWKLLFFFQYKSQISLQIKLWWLVCCCLSAPLQAAASLWQFHVASSLNFKSSLTFTEWGKTRSSCLVFIKWNYSKSFRGIKDINKKIRKTKFIYICSSKNGSSSSTVQKALCMSYASYLEFGTKIQIQ